MMAGEKLGVYFKNNLVEVPNLTNRTEVAKAIVEALPSVGGILSFIITFDCTGVHQSYGYIYNNKKHGVMRICTLYSGIYDISISDGEYKIVK